MYRAWPTAVLLTFSSALSAQHFDARNHAMGGVGVASTHYLNAGVANPALLTRFDEGDDFGFALPSIGAFISDEDGLLDAIQAFEDQVDEVQASLNSGSASPAQLANLANSLLAISGKRGHAGVGAGFALTLPSKELAVSLFLNTYLDAQAFAQVDPADLLRIATASTAADLDDLQSEAVIIGAAVTDVGLALAHEFELPGSTLSVGITPKLQRVDTFNYSADVNNFEGSNFDDSQFRNDDTGFNLDLGAAFSPLENLTIGLMGRNLIEHDFDTVVTNGSQFTYTIEPTVTAGVAWSNGTLALALDLDITEFERFARSDGSRIVRVGGEVNAGGHAQLRAGVLHDLEDNLDTAVSAGIGLSPFDLLHIDVAASTSGKDSYGAVLQLSVTF